VDQEKYIPVKVNFQSVIAITHYYKSQFSEIVFYPIELFFEGPNDWRGIPRLADEATGVEILEHFASACEEFGTTFKMEISPITKRTCGVFGDGVA
jgi:hypothetical protein